MNELYSKEKTILYYPTIKIEDGSWLRNAILYWDNVASIVPGFDYNEFNSIEIEYLREAGIYKPIYPNTLADSGTLCEQFCREVKEKLKESRKSNDEKIMQIHREKIAMSQNSMLHIDKTPNLILDFLKDEGIVMENCEGPWLDIKSSEAEVYLSILAKYLAKIERNTDIGTDLSTKFLEPYGGTNKKEQEKQLYLDMALQDILPEPNKEGVSIQDIIDFRMEYKKELHCFRKRIELFHDSLKWHTEDIYDMFEKTEKFKNEIAMDLQMIEDLLNQKNFSFKHISLRSLLPIGLMAGIELAAFRGGIIELQEICAEMFINTALALYSSKSVINRTLSEGNTYLFYAKKQGLIE